MKFEEFLGATYALPQFQVDCQRSLNLIPQVVAADGGSRATRLILVRAPGLALRQTLPDSPGRGAFALNGRAFAVAGSSFYELLSPTTYIQRGTIAAGTSAVKFDANGVQVGFVADGRGYMFTLATNAFAQVTDVNFPNPAVGLTSIDTYFLTLAGGTNQFFYSALLDGLTWSGIDFSATDAPDHGVTLTQNNNYLWVFGQQRIIVFQDTGATSKPFQRVPGVQIEMGCAAAASVASVDNTLFWLGSSSLGAGAVYRADGFLPTRISTHALESAIANYATISDATAYGYSEAGHTFYRLDFPTANATWVYDSATRLWHERAYWDLSTGSFQADLARYHCYCFGAHLVVDYQSGNVYEQSLDFADHAGNPLRWLRAAPRLNDGQKRLFYYSIEIDMQRGSAVDGGGQGSDPVVFIRWSDDGGGTWSDYRQASTGALGAYATRVKVRRCGSGRNRVWEVSGSDPVPQLALIGAELHVMEGSS